MLVDVKSEDDRARSRRHHRSWFNAYTADLAVAVLRQLLTASDAGISVAIIIPHRAQVRELQTRFKTLQDATQEDLTERVEIGTIHQFQGNEADVVIFDVVDRVPRHGPGALLRGDTGIRLVNVATTRARGKLIVLADQAWCRRRMQRSDNPLLRTLVVDRPTYERIDARAAM